MSMFKKVAIVVVPPSALVLGLWALLGSGDRGSAEPGSHPGLTDEEVPTMPASPGVSQVGSNAQHPSIGNTTSATASEVSPTPEAAPSPSQSPVGPSASELAHQRALADPKNPERWIEYAKALDSEGKSSLALAALRRALHLGVDFEGRREVERLVREYEEYLDRKNYRPPRDRRAAPEPSSKPTHSRTR